MRVILLAAGLGLLVGFGAAWAWQGSRWDADVADISKKQSDDLLAAYQDREARIAEAESKKEEIQNAFDAFRAAEDKRNTDIGGGAKRVYVRANCPALPATQADTSRASGGAAELDPAYRSTLSALRWGVEEQRRLLNSCRAELMSR